jgi:ribosome-associated toxin RatA of RatAB toxin-antitoxin module
MAPLRESIEIARSPEDVFAYVDDLARHGEWQQMVVSARVDGDGPTRVGTRVTEVRRLGKREETITYEVTEHDPPRAFAFRGIDGPIRPIGRATFEPLADGSRTRVTLELDFAGHGFGKFLLPVARKVSGKQVPQDQQRLKQHLESEVA